MRLFVYGTLCSGGSRGGMLGNRPRQAAEVRGRLYALPAGYPALVLGGEQRVYGELVEDVDEGLLRLLDHYEGVDEQLFTRVTARVVLGLRAVDAWTYTMDHPTRHGGVLSSSGRWQQLRTRRS